MVDIVLDPTLTDVDGNVLESNTLHGTLFPKEADPEVAPEDEE